MTRQMRTLSKRGEFYHFTVMVRIPSVRVWLHIDNIRIIYCEIYLQTYRHDMTYSVLKVPLNPNQPTFRVW